MALVPGDIKIVPPLQQTLAGDGTRSYKVYRIRFAIRGEGNYSVDIPVDGYTPEKAQKAIEDKARGICETLDLFK
jgi:hypothetical protein